MVCHGRSVLQCAAVLQIRRDSGRPKTVISHLRLNAGGRRPPADHRIGVGLGQGRPRQLPGAPADGPKQWPLGIVGQAGALDVGDQVRFEIMVAWHFVVLAALLAQPKPT